VAVRGEVYVLPEIYAPPAELKQSSIKMVEYATFELQIETKPSFLPEKKHLGTKPPSEKILTSSLPYSFVELSSYFIELNFRKIKLMPILVQYYENIM